MALMTNDFLSDVLERLEPIGEIRVRAMLGGYGLYYRKVIFGIVVFDELYFRVNEDTILEYRYAGSSPFIYPGKHKPMTMSYWSVPDHILEDQMWLEQWMMAAYEAARGQKKVKRRKPEKKLDA